jgi:protein LSM14
MNSLQLPFLNSRISLVSRSGFNYEGILYSINTEKSTVALKNGKTFLPKIKVKILDDNGKQLPNSKIYEFIVFKGNDNQKLTVLKVKKQK